MTRLCLLVLLVLVKAFATGQEVLNPAATESQPIQIPPGAYPEGSESSLAPPPRSAPQSRATPLEWGSIRAYPRLSYRFLYGDAIQPRPGEPLTTAVHEVSPGIELNLGDHWRLDYAPIFQFYSNDQFRDTINQGAGLDGKFMYENWTFGLSQHYTSSSQPLIETATQTDEETFLTALWGSYSYNSSVSFDLGAYQKIRLVTDFSDSREWTTQDWANYRWGPKIELGIGLGFGYLDVGQGSDMTYEQVMGRVLCRLGEKLSAVLSVGADYRQFLSGGVPDLLSPTFQAALDYQLFEQTKLTLRGARVLSPSYFADELATVDDVSLNVHQRLLGKLFLDFETGFRSSHYTSTSAAVQADRTDKYWYLLPRLSCTFLRHGRFSVFYQYSDNGSSQEGYSYKSDQVGVEISYGL